MSRKRHLFRIQIYILSLLLATVLCIMYTPAVRAAMPSTDSVSESKSTGSIIVSTSADPLPADPEFEFEYDGDLGYFNMNGDGADRFDNIPAGEYKITQRVPEGWALIAIGCNDPDEEIPGGVIVHLDPGETLRCTFYNKKYGTIVIQKETDPTVDTRFRFTDTITATHSFSLTHSQSMTFTQVLPGPYVVREEDPTPDFDLTDLTCADGEPTGTASTTDLSMRMANIQLDPGETVTCTFKNTERGTIAIYKETDPPNIAREFDFTGELGNFDVQTGGREKFTHRRPGDYKVTEVVPFGWRLTSVECTHGGHHLIPDGIEIDLDPGQRVNCTFLNDKAGVTLFETDGRSQVAEQTGQSDRYEVVLDSPPTAPVTIQIHTDGQVSTSKSQLLFDETNWHIPQRVDIEAVDDDLVEGEHSGLIHHSVTSADPNYNDDDHAARGAAGVPFATNGITQYTAPNSVHVEIEDTPAVIITETDASTDVAEGTGMVADNGEVNDLYTLMLTRKPRLPVTIQIYPDEQIETSKSNVVFNAGNWKQPQKVIVTAVDDGIDEGDHSGDITHRIESDDPAYSDAVRIVGNGPTSQTAPNIVRVNITDDDMAGVIVDVADLEALREGVNPSTDQSAKYRVVLKSQPTAQVVISIQTDDQLSAQRDQLVFDQDNWSTPQSVEIYPVDDSIDEGGPGTLHQGLIQHRASSTDPKYAGINIENVMVNIIDDDQAGVHIAPTSLNLIEGGDFQRASGDILRFQEESDSGTYSVVLTSQPVDTVVITIQTGDRLQANVAQVAFDATNWNRTQDVTITVIDDNTPSGVYSQKIVHAVTSADPRYNQITAPHVLVEVTDLDNPGVVVLPGGIDISEGGTTGTYNVLLTTQPMEPVSVHIHSDEQSRPSVTQLLFDDTNWNLAQEVIVTAVDDAVAEGPHLSYIEHEVISADLHYNGIVVSGVTADIADNDEAGIFVSPTHLATTEGENVIYQLYLTSQPLAPVTIHIQADGNVRTNVEQLVFHADNWSNPQRVTVTAAEDFIAEGQHIGIVTHSVSTDDPTYLGLPVDDVHITITDNDQVGVVVSTQALVIAEGGAEAAYTIVLNSQPIVPVTVDIHNDGQVTVEPGQLIFTGANWDLPQTVKVMAADDDIAESIHGGGITHAVHSEDPLYNGFSVVGITINITDNDQAGVLFSSNSANVVEGGMNGTDSDTYSLRLTSQPIAPVTIEVVGDDQVVLDIGVAAQIIDEGANEEADIPRNVAQNRVQLTFDATNWSRARTIIVTAVDDAVAEGIHNSILIHSATSTDPNYNAISIPNFDVQIADNDSPSVSVTPGTIHVAEGPPGVGTTASYAVVLTTQPTAPVTVTARIQNLPIDVNENPFLVKRMIFNETNWHIPQNVTIAAVDDDIVEGTHMASLSHMAESDDPAYDGIPVPSVTVIIFDDDGNRDPDNDTLLTQFEDLNGDENPANDDTDRNGIPNYLDSDDDGDGILTADEDANGNGDLSDDDSDGDGTPNYLDNDDDGDGILTAEEDVNQNGNFNDDDSDGDGVPDYLDSANGQNPGNPNSGGGGPNPGGPQDRFIYLPLIH